MPVNDWLKIFGNPKFYEVFKGFLVISSAYENTFKVFVFDSVGGPIALEQDSIVITRTAATVDAIPASHSIAIAVLDKVGGPQVLSPLEVVKIFEEVGGQPLAVEFVPEEALRAQKADATDPLQESFAALMLTYAKGDPIEMETTLKTFPIQLASVRDYAEDVLATS